MKNNIIDLNDGITALMNTRLQEISNCGFDSAQQAEALDRIKPCTGLDGTPYSRYFDIARDFMTRHLPPYPGQEYSNRIKAEALELLNNYPDIVTGEPDYFLQELLKLACEALEWQQNLCELAHGMV